jgi:hypothetical protein
MLRRVEFGHFLRLDDFIRVGATAVAISATRAAFCCAK